MKNFTFIIFCFLLFSNCNNETANKTNKNEAKKSSSKIENFDCASFFKKGDYSSICFIDSKLPKYNGSGCTFSFQTKGDKQEENLMLRFELKNTPALAQMHFNLKKDNYIKGTIKDVSNLGDAAFFDSHLVDLKSRGSNNKDLHVHYKNLAFVIKSDYRSNADKPCFFNDKELIAFAKEIIDNL